ncbi:MAG: hypothetical protein KJ771_00115 [Nanoarchaeota archaeon]|nr:hypothetical protein [Nanoarchaeota archaeon]
MNLIQESFQRLFPDKEFSYQTKLEYNRRLADFNANIRLHQNNIQINLNLQWKDIEDEIKIGLIQHLLLKIFKQKKLTTPNINLYNNFVKNIDILATKTKPDPTLLLSFWRVNELFFYNRMEQPNLQWGQQAFRKLASYNYHNDTVTVSTIFQDQRDEILDYLMYHELLHKFHKFKHKNGRSSYHNKEFKDTEKLYPNYQEMEREISKIIRMKKTPKKSRWRFF